MTTIAYRAGSLAADSLVTTSTHRDGFATKIVKRGHVLFAAAGLYSLALGFLDWARVGMPADRAPQMWVGTDPNDDAQGFIFLPDGPVIVYGRRGWSRKRLLDYAPYYAIGSGADYAYGAMAMGATAEEAVASALIFETCSGGPITVLRHYP